MEEGSEVSIVSRLSLTSKVEFRFPHRYDEHADTLWSFYVSEADQHDKDITETWKVDMDSTLIFAGLFSATVTAFIVESSKQLKQDSGDVSNALLAQILAAQIALLSPEKSTLPSIANITFNFVPPTSAVVVNVLWFLSLSCSLSAALCATLVQQWVKDYMQRVQRHKKPLRRARVRAFLFNGTQKWRMNEVVQCIPALLHLSLFLFFAGLLVFLGPISPAVACTVGTVIICCLISYGLATLAPVIDLSSPYETVLSTTCWNLRHRVTSWYHQYDNHRKSSSQLTRARTQRALDSYFQDIYALLSALSWITDERELQQFSAGIPGFLESEEGRWTWGRALEWESSPLSHVEARIFTLLDSCSTVMESKSRQVRASACVGALFAMSRHQANPRKFLVVDLPLTPPKYSMRRSLSEYIGVAITGNDDTMSITKAICTMALLSRRTYHHAFLHLRLPDMKLIYELSSKADEALKEADLARKSLEDVLGFPSMVLDIGIETTTPTVAAVLETYLSKLLISSHDLHTWMKAMAPVFSDLGLSRGTSDRILSWYSNLPCIRRSVTYQNAEALVGTPQSFEFYAHEVLAFMRATSVYPSLSDTSHFIRIDNCLLPFTTMIDFTLEGRHLARELSPFCSALNSLNPDLSLLRSQGHEELAWKENIVANIGNRDYIGAEFPKEHLSYDPPIFMPRGPFSTLTYILDDIQNGCRVVPLLALFAEFKTYTAKVFDTSVILQTIDTVFPPGPETLTDGSQMLLVILLHEILIWNNPQSFPKVVIMQLAERLKDTLQSELSLTAAEQILGSTNPRSSESTSRDGTQQFATRVECVYNHIVQRTSL
ncbi:hypothetical protein C0995_001150 [Termitomyces sp. Mi166|nr:hypothetical protein C0995_001150 [Termitomyces sp. Mi166\